MARVEGICSCTKCDDCPNAGVQGWVDAISGVCRACEIDHGNRWGHRNPSVKAEEGSQRPGEHLL